MPTIGLLINPVAGIGGPAGLRGSDGADTQRRARERGAVAAAPRRARDALAALVEAWPDTPVLTGGGGLGEDAARDAGCRVGVVHRAPAGTTTPEDTRRTVTALLDRGVDVVLVAGGDGTARDVAAVYRNAAGAAGADGQGLPPVVGVPGGVKMHSGVFARSPRTAGLLAAEVLRAAAAGRAVTTRQAEVVDHDEEARRAGVLSTSLHGHLPVPARTAGLQGGKVGAGRSGGDAAGIAGLAAECARRMREHDLWVLGPGTTVAAAARALGVDNTLLGIDVVDGGTTVGRDVDARRLADLTAGRRPRLLLSPVGGQGMILGRGNQQLDAAFLARLRPADLHLAATPEKLAALAGGPLWVDAPTPELGDLLAGHHRVVTGWQQYAVLPVRSANAAGTDAA
ncbi:ATP-NAD kinase family protein [Streptomyces sp. NPDC056061]|uniref:ATP-NAD kinase family protein n=1 Tax=Streptomyces sp. NPDC056061 TaxID=3345700 RepID=UPI0035DD19CA